MIQFAIAVTGVAAIWLTQSKSEQARKRACLFGLAGQPFWFASAIAAEQWGIVVLCCFYTVAWARGVWTHWVAPLIRSTIPARAARRCEHCGGGPVFCRHCMDPKDICDCHNCRNQRTLTLADIHMVLCPICGNKRCPKATDHRNTCTWSNEPGQPGSAY